MEVTQLLDPFGFAPDGKVVIAHLPELRLTRRSQLARSDLLEHLNHERELAVLRLPDEQVDMLGHYHVSGDGASIPAPDSFPFVFERVAGRGRVEQFHSLITTERDEVQTSLVLIPDRLDVHLRRL